MGDVFDLAVGNDNICFARQHGSHQLWNVTARILIIGVCVDDDVRAQTKCRFQSGLEGTRKPHVLPMGDDMVDAQTAGHVGRAVRAAVIDNQRFDTVDARHV